MFFLHVCLVIERMDVEYYSSGGPSVVLVGSARLTGNSILSRARDNLNIPFVGRAIPYYSRPLPTV